MSTHHKVGLAKCLEVLGLAQPQLTLDNLFLGLS